jgi:hypothetical protein
MARCLRRRRCCLDANLISTGWRFLIGEGRTCVVTLIGPGGVGKTRLTIETIHGRCAVRLACVSRRASGFASAIGRALAAPTREGEPAMAALRRFLGDRHLLLAGGARDAPSREAVRYRHSRQGNEYRRRSRGRGGDRRYERASRARGLASRCRGRAAHSIPSTSATAGRVRG